MSAARKLIAAVARLGGGFVVDGERVRVRAPAPLPDDLLAELRANKAEIAAALAPPPATFDPGRLQRDADRRNHAAMRAGVTDRWCRCGRLATCAWVTPNGGEAWRCLECAPAKGRA